MKATVKPNRSITTIRKGMIQGGGVVEEKDVSNWAELIARGILILETPDEPEETCVEAPAEEDMESDLAAALLEDPIPVTEEAGEEVKQPKIQAGRRRRGKRKA